MCLNADTRIHSVGEHFMPKVAKVPLLVWKNLCNANDINGFSPYRNHCWTFGENKSAILNSVRYHFGYNSVDEGLHAHILSVEQRSSRFYLNCYLTPGCSLWPIRDGRLYPAVIPTGTKFVIGRNADIVAESMTVYRNKQHMFEALGIDKLADPILRETIKTW